MKLREAVDVQQWYSGKLSENIRFLALSGFALLWVLSEQKVWRFRMPLLAWPLGLLVGVLVADTFQYFVGAETWDRLVRREEAAGTAADAELVGDAGMAMWIYACYWAKAVLLFVAYVLIARAFTVLVLRGGLGVEV